MKYVMMVIDSLSPRALYMRSRTYELTAGDGVICILLAFFNSISKPVEPNKPYPCPKQTEAERNRVRAIMVKILPEETRYDQQCKDEMDEQ